MINLRATVNTGMRGDKLAYHSGMFRGISLDKNIRRGSIAAHRLKHTTSKVKIRHMPPADFRVRGKWDVTDTWASTLGHCHQTQKLFG